MSDFKFHVSTNLNDHSHLERNQKILNLNAKQCSRDFKDYYSSVKQVFQFNNANSTLNPLEDLEKLYTTTQNLLEGFQNETKLVISLLRKLQAPCGNCKMQQILQKQNDEDGENQMTSISKLIRENNSELDGNTDRSDGIITLMVHPSVLRSPSNKVKASEMFKSSDAEQSLKDIKRANRTTSCIQQKQTPVAQPLNRSRSARHVRRIVISPIQTDIRNLKTPDREDPTKNYDEKKPSLNKDGILRSPGVFQPSNISLVPRFLETGRQKFQSHRKNLSADNCYPLTPSPVSPGSTSFMYSLPRYKKPEELNKMEITAPVTVRSLSRTQNSNVKEVEGTVFDVPLGV